MPVQNYINGDLGLNIFTKKGVVLSSNVSSETHVRSHGGDSYTAPTIRSTIHREQEIWIKKPGGVDECIRLNECNLQGREGHRVTFIYAGRLGEDTGYPTMLINHDTAKWFWISGANDLVSMLKVLPDQGFGCAILIAMAVGLGMVGIGPLAYQEAMKYHRANATDSVQMYVLVIIGGLLLIWSYLSYTRRKKNTARRRQFVAGLQSHLEGLVTATTY